MLEKAGWGGGADAAEADAQQPVVRMIKHRVDVTDVELVGDLRLLKILADVSQVGSILRLQADEISEGDANPSKCQKTRAPSQKSCYITHNCLL